MKIKAKLARLFPKSCLTLSCRSACIVMLHDRAACDSVLSLPYVNLSRVFSQQLAYASSCALLRRWSASCKVCCLDRRLAISVTQRAAAPSVQTVPENRAKYCIATSRHNSCLFREGNPHRMHCKILYTLRPEGIRCYFSDNISRTVTIGINVSPVRCTI